MMLLSEMSREFSADQTFTLTTGEDNFNGGRGDQLIFGDGAIDGAIDGGAGDGTITITVENMSAEGGTFQTPVWFGFHDGTYDLFDIGSEASAGLERLAEDGETADLEAEFQAETGHLGGVISNSETNEGEESRVPLAPGDIASIDVNLDDPAIQGFFSWATMVIPSNDAFLASPDDPMAVRVFDADGIFLGPVEIEVSGDDVLDAGTEANLEQDAAFLNQTAPNTGVDGNGTVAPHLGFNGSEGNPTTENVNILAGDLPDGTATTNDAGATIDPLVADFTANPDAPIFRISIDQATVDQVPVAEEGADDMLSGGLGDDEIHGGAGDDTLHGNRGDDLVFGGTDSDTIRGGRGDDELHGDDGDDEIYGNRGDDTIDGGDGDDELHGNRGDDKIYGGDGDDDIDGDRGDDWLNGGAGEDELTGGRGDDTFVFVEGTGFDTVSDFNSSGQDEINVSDFGFTTKQEVMDRATDEDGDTLIQLNEDGDQILLKGVSVDELELEDFIIEFVDDVEEEDEEDIAAEEEFDVSLVGVLASELGQENFII